eukprot:14863534-Ditylum_brightwellii.AAC.1
MDAFIYAQKMMVTVSRPLHFSARNLDQINAFRAGKSYVDTRAAKNINGTEMKVHLDEDLFVQLFEYGSAEGKQGYWSYDHMILQLED